jgi:phosphoribosylamine--glycine ligase
VKILVVGSGGREHALAWKLKFSPKVTEVFIAPGNPGTVTLGTNVPIKADDIAGLVQFAKDTAINLTVVGPETPLVLGITDAFIAAGLRCWGPSKACAKLEGSKVEMKEFLRRQNIPTAQFKVFNKAADAHTYLDEVDGPIVVKSDGLAAGKGVTVAKNAAEAHDAVERVMVKQEFGRDAGAQLVIEEILRGEEISVFALCDGHNAVLLDYAQDHKQVNDGDQGPMTGGMGAFSPVPGLMRPRDEDEMVRRIVVPTMSGLVKEGRPYQGVLFLGLMVGDTGVKVLEYNVRFGDPETQTLMMRLQTDLVDLLNACIDGTLDRHEISWSRETSVCVTLAAGGYPGTYQNGQPITGIESAEKLGCTVFHAGTALKDGQLVTAGGRVLSVCATGRDLEEARRIAYAGCAAIQFTGKHCRTDIGTRKASRGR